MDKMPEKPKHLEGMERSELLLRAAAELAASPDFDRLADREEWLLKSEYFKHLRIKDGGVAVQLLRIAEVLADG